VQKQGQQASKIEVILKDLRTRPEREFLDAGATKALKQFQEMARRVPAYREYLAARQFDAASVRTPAGFTSVPPVDKADYLRKYPRADLCWDGDLKSKSWIISTTSGSTGEPFYFPRGAEQDEQYALTAELYLRSNFKIHERSTLYIVAFPMGAWIGGVFTYEALRRVAENGPYALSIITPGINKQEVIKAVQNLARDFDQIIIGSYAPFLKDIIDDGIRAGVDWPSYNLGIVFSAEGFSEKFRDYVAAKTGLKNIYTDTLNHYGTVDQGTIAHETPVCILIRRLALANPELYQAIFGQPTKIPTLCQYHPEHFYFEDHDGDIYCSADSGLPLVRYDLKDRGGVITLARMEKIFAEQGLNLRDEMAAAGIADTLWNLPFVYVYERSDFSVSFFAFQVYPETVRNALAQGDFPEKLTGKFTMTVDYDTEGQQQLTIHLELKPETPESAEMEEAARAAIVERLLQENSEYRQTHQEYGERVHPKLVFWLYEHPTYFRPGTKQKWVQK